MTQRWDCDTPRRVESPGDLAELLKNVAEAVNSGKLKQIVTPNSPFATQDDVRTIPYHGPWPDYLELHFQDPETGNRYRLLAETFHGSGGSWGLVS